MSKDSEDEIYSDSDNDNDPYKVKVFKTNKDEIFQPSCVDNELIPKLSTSMCVIGKSGSGKTNSVISMLTNERMLKDAFDFIYLFSGIKPDQELIEPLKLPKHQVFNDFEEDDVKKIMDKMEKTVEKNGMKNTPSVLFIFDDILGKPKFLKSSTMSKLITTNRHFNISVIIMSQYFKKLPPVIRTNCSYYMIFPSSMVEIEKVSDELCPPNMSKRKFIEIIQFATDDKYNFISINTKCGSKKMLRKNFGKIIDPDQF